MIGRLRKQAAGFWAAALTVCVCYAALHFLLGTAPFAPSCYNSYTLQAMAWREGRISLGVNYPHLELAVFQNDWYVSFPPVPSVVQWVLTFFFGLNTPDGLLVKLYPLVGCLACCLALKRAGLSPSRAGAWAFFLIYGSCLFPITLDGGVWYQAQTLGLALSMGAAAAMFSGRPTLACALYALSVGCRPFNVCLGPVLLAMYITKCRQKGLAFGSALKRLLPGLAAGLAIACAYGAYNYARFGNPLEFGHTYLPEFQRSPTGQFSLSHAAQNISRFFFGLPFYHTEQGWQVEKFGFSMFLSNPVFLLLFAWAAEDLWKKRLTLPQGAALLLFFLHLFLLLLHRTFGGYQFGARYTLDLLPYCLIYRLCAANQRGLRLYEGLALSLGMVLNLVGAFLLG